VKVERKPMLAVLSQPQNKNAAFPKESGVLFDRDT